MSDPGVVSDDTVFALQVGRRKIPLSPAQGFDLAEHLIRGATRRMIVEEADRAAVLNVLHMPVTALTLRWRMPRGAALHRIGRSTRSKPISFVC